MFQRRIAEIRELDFVPVIEKDYHNQIGVVGGSWRNAPDEAWFRSRDFSGKSRFLR